MPYDRFLRPERRDRSTLPHTLIAEHTRLLLKAELYLESLSEGHEPVQNISTLPIS